MGRVFANGLGDQGSIPGRVIPKTLKIVLDTSLLNTQQYKVRIEGKVGQSRERSSTLLYTYIATEKGAFWSPSTTVANFTYYFLYLHISWLIDYNSFSTCLGLGNHIHCIYIFTFYRFWGVFCIQSYWIQIVFKQIYLTHKQGLNWYFNSRSE